MPPRYEFYCALACAVLLRGKHGKLRFPVAEHVCLNARYVADFAYFEEEFFGDGDGCTVHFVGSLSEKRACCFEKLKALLLWILSLVGEPFTSWAQCYSRAQ